MLQGRECKRLCVEYEGRDLTDKKVGGRGGMRRGIWGWEGGRPLIRAGHIGCSGAAQSTQPLLTGHALHHIRLGPPGPVGTSQNMILFWSMVKKWPPV